MREKLSTPQPIRLPLKMLHDCNVMAEKYGVPTSQIFRMLLGRALYGEPQKTIKTKKTKSDDN